MRLLRLSLAILLLSIGINGCGRASIPASPQSGIPVSATNATGEQLAVIEAAKKKADDGELSIALDHLSTALANAPKSVPLLHARASVYSRMGQLDNCMTDLDQAIKLAPGDAVLMNNRGFLHLNRSEYESALSDLNAAIALAPKYPQPHNNRGLVLLAQGKLKESVAEFNNALLIDPTYADAYNNRGFAEVEAGQLEPALADFDAALKLKPKYVNAFNNRGILKTRAGDFDAAIVDFTQAAMLDPENPKYYRHRREVYLRVKNYEKATEDERHIRRLETLQGLSIAAATNPTGSGYMALAAHHEQHGEIAASFRNIAKVMELEPSNALAYVHRARLHLANKNYRQARGDCDLAIRMQDSTEAHSVRGDAELALQDYDAALSDFDVAKRFDAAVAEAFFRKSQRLEQQGAADDAKAQRERAIALDPSIESRLR